MNTTSQMLKEAKELYEKYFPEDWHRNILYSSTVTTTKEFTEEVYRFLRKYSENSINTTLEAVL